MAELCCSKWKPPPFENREGWGNLSYSSAGRKQRGKGGPAPDNLTCTGGWNSWLHYAGDFYDSETGLDYTLFRQHSSTQGRWMTPDPAGLAAVDPTNPQTWNRYAYVMNNPLALVDPLGLCDPVGDAVECDETTVTAPAPDVPLVHFQLPQPVDGSLGRRGFLNFGFTLGVRAPSQTYSQCMSANSGNYSIAGAFNLQSEGAKFALGNDVSQLLFGNTAEGTGGLALWEGGSSSVEGGVGEVMTAGRRTASIMDLNLAGTTGPAPMILGKTAAEQLAGWLSGLAEIKMAIDVGLTGAQAIGCTIHR